MEVVTLAQRRRVLKAGTVPEGGVDEQVRPAAYLALGERPQLDDLHAAR
jgi:hypothetical protein